MAESGCPVVGIDGAAGGWVAVRCVPGEALTGYWSSSFAEVMEREADVAVVAVDMPIGLPEAGRRACDRLAREFVGARRSSVFSTPVRAALEAESYAAARQISVERTGWSVSSQAWHLRRAIFEVEAFAGDPRVFEVHPEVSFRQLAGASLAYPKRSWDGFQLRLRMLREAGIEPPAEIGGVKAAVDDVTDATVAAWSARRIAARVARSLPSPPEGVGGRAMAIWY